MTRFKRVAMLLLILSVVAVTACSKGPANTQSGGTNSPSSTSNEETSSSSNNGSSAEKPDPLAPLEERITVNLVKKIRVGDDQIPEGETLTENKWVTAVEQALNIKLNFLWSQKDPAYSEKIKLAIASNDLPDIFNVDYTTYLQLVKDDMIEDLTPYQDYRNEYLKKTQQTDGGKSIETLTVGDKIYGFSSMGAVDNSAQVAWVRKDWLDAQGLKEPATIDDLAAIVTAFNKAYGTTGIPGQEDSGTGSNRSMFGFEGLAFAYSAKPFIWTQDASGKVVYGSVQPEMKEALAQMQALYQSGVLDKEFSTTKNDQFAQKVASGKAGVFFGPWWSGWFPIADNIKADPQADWRAYTIKDASGQYYGKQEAPVGEILVVRKGFSNPELLYKLWNYQSDVEFDPYKDDEQSQKISWNGWPIDIPFWAANGGVKYSKNFRAAIAGTAIDTLTDMTPKEFADLTTLYENFQKKDANAWPEIISRQYGMGALIEETNNNRVFNEFNSVTPAMEKRWVNLTKLELDTFLQIILGTKSPDYFDEFVKQWNAQGGNEITSEVNAALGL